MHSIGAGDAKMNRNARWNDNAMGDEQVLLGDHTYRDRAVSVLFGSKIAFDELPRQVQGERVDLSAS